VFHQGTGRIYDESEIDVSCIQAIRQFCLVSKKIKLPCTPEREREALNSFVAIEHDLSVSELQESDTADFLAVSSVLWGNIDAICSDSLIPRHGPGAVEERLSSNAKYSWKRWHNRLEPYFPFAGTAYTVSSYGSEEFESVTVVSECDEQPVRVITVPKTLKSPRIIAIEPCCQQYVQQAIRRSLYDWIERAPLTTGHVNFRDQNINRSLALVASSGERSLATLDLSEASDRVIYSLAIRMFDSNPDLKDAITACRSTRALLPNGEVITDLKKFASMGSALCFPVESMYFYTICVVALLRKHNLPVTFRNVLFVSRDVYVYGDDLFVPQHVAVDVVSCLQKYYCKVNANKSFWTGKFRESCGMDAYNGIDVTPIYIRYPHPNSKRQASEIVSWVKTANMLEKSGMCATSDYMFSVVEKIIGPLPVVHEKSPLLGRTTTHRSLTVGRKSPSVKTKTKQVQMIYPGTEGYMFVPGPVVNGSAQHLEVKGWVAEPVYNTDTLEGYAALMKSLSSLAVQPIRSNLMSDELPAIDDKHLERSARHGAVALKLRWVPVGFDYRHSRC
jgi:hypothetical protein